MTVTSNIVNFSYEISSLPVICFFFCPKLIKSVPPQGWSCIRNTRHKNSNIRSTIYIVVHKKCNLVKLTSQFKGCTKEKQLNYITELGFTEHDKLQKDRKIRIKMKPISI